MAHLSPLQLVQVGEAMHVIATQRDQAITERDHADDRAEEWERAARGSAAAAVGWQSKHQALEERAAQIADHLDGVAGALEAGQGKPETVAAVLVDLIARLRGAGESLPSDGEVVRTEETVKVGNKL